MSGNLHFPLFTAILWNPNRSSEDCDSPQIVGFSGDTCLEGSGGARDLGMVTIPPIKMVSHCDGWETLSSSLAPH